MWRQTVDTAAALHQRVVQTLQLWLGFDDPSPQCAVVDFSNMLLTDQELRCRYSAHVSLYSHVQKSEYRLCSIITEPNPEHIKSVC